MIALVLANSPVADDFQAFWHTPIHLQIGAFRIGGELGHFVVNDVLMTIFFFVVGLEIKRELVAGELRRSAQGGFAGRRGARRACWCRPAIYMVLQIGISRAFAAGASRWRPTSPSWSGAMAILGPRVPFGLKIMVLSLAIADDIGAVIVIAMFYSTGLNWSVLGLAALGFGLIYCMNRVGVRAIGDLRRRSGSASGSRSTIRASTRQWPASCSAS